MGPTQNPKYLGLRKFNMAMGVLHLVQGALMLALVTGASAPVWETLLNYDEITGEPVHVRSTIVELPLGVMVAMFLFTSAVAHFYVSSPMGYPWYVKNLEKGVNYARWFEYGISSSIMVVVIAMLCGIWELSSLILIFALNATMNMWGLMMERHNQTTEKTDWTAYIIGCFAGIVPWIVMGIYFFGAVMSNAESVPPFVYAIFFTLAAFFNVFALNMVWQYRKKGKWRDYLFGEKVYILLSLTAKSALAWLVFFGTQVLD